MIARMRRAVAGLRRGWGSGPGEAAAAATSASPPRPASGAGPVPGSRADPSLDELLRDVERNKRRAGLTDTDPMTPLIDAMLRLAVHEHGTAQAVIRSNAELARATQDGIKDIGHALALAPEVGHAEAGRLRAAADGILATLQHDLGQAVIRSSNEALNWRSRAIDANTAAMIVVTLVICTLVAAGCGARGGWLLARSGILEIEDSLQAAFAQGPDAARTWADLMAWNPDLPGVLTGCRRYTSPGGDRKACTVAVWAERDHALVAPQASGTVTLEPTMTTGGRAPDPVTAVPARPAAPPKAQESPFGLGPLPQPNGPVQFGPARR